ncbi:MAG: tetratricopeptide repeat protein [Myxococcus sp.]|nr:tetratricopeptide repeat protein [Myxococcus sp.]
MRLDLKNLIGLDGNGPTFAQTYGITFDQGVEWAEQGLEMAREGRLDEARVILEGLVTLNPRSPGYWYALGAVYEKQELVDDAEQAFSQATARDPRNLDAWMRLGLLKLKRGDGAGLEALRKVANDARADNAELVARAKSILATSRAA